MINKLTLTKKCAVCTKVFEKPVNCSVKNWGKRKNCSFECQTKYWVGRSNARKQQGSKNSVPAWNKGIPSPFVGELNNKWKGDEVSYSGVHHWVTKWKGRPTVCEKCGTKGLKGHKIHWANIDHKYKRVLDDYIRLCSQCHSDYDRENKLK